MRMYSQCIKFLAGEFVFASCSHSFVLFSAPICACSEQKKKKGFLIGCLNNNFSKSNLGT